MIKTPFNRWNWKQIGSLKAAIPQIITVSEIGTWPTLSELQHGDQIQNSLSAGADDTANYASSEATISSVTEVITVDGSPATLTDVVAYGEQVSSSYTVLDALGNERIFPTATQTVAGIAPTLAISSSQTGRTLTITVDSTTGVPAPETTLTVLELDGNPVSPTTTGSGVWTYEVPDSEDFQVIGWTVEASNVEDVATQFDSAGFVANLFAPQIVSAPTITGSPVPGGTVTITNATVSGNPAPTITPTLALGELDVTAEIQNGTYQIPPTATIGTSLTLVSVASNDILPDAQDSVSVTISEAVENWTPEQLSVNDATRRNVYYIPGETPAYQDAGESIVATADGDSVERWGTGAGGEAGMTLEKLGAGAAPVLATRDGIRVLRFTDGVTDPLNLAFSSSWSRPTTFYILYFNDPDNLQTLVVPNDGATAFSTNTIRSDPGPGNALDVFMGNELQGFTAQTPGLQAAIVELDNAGQTTVYLKDTVLKHTRTVTSDGPLEGIRLGANGSVDYAAIVAIEGTLTPQEIEDIWQYGIGTLAANSTTGHSPVITHENNSAFKPDIANARIVTAKSFGYAPVTIESFWGRMTVVWDDPDFDNVVNMATGERLYGLLYTSTDHATVTPTSGGIFLTCVFGDPVTGTYKAYADALADGDLDNYPGSKPLAADSKIFSPGYQAETPQVIKIGSDWVLLWHGQDSAAIEIGGQATYRASSASPFGGFVKTPSPYADDEFLSDNTFSFPGQAHTGYAMVMEVPPESTFPGAYWIGSKWETAGEPKNMIWQADANLLNPVPIAGVPSTGDAPTNLDTFMPDWATPRAGDPVKIGMARVLKVFWTGAYFRAIVAGNVNNYIVLFEVKLNADLVSMDQAYAEPIIGPDDMKHLFFETDRLADPQVIVRPSGGLALLVACNDESVNINMNLIMPLDMDMATPRILSAPEIIGVPEPGATVTIKSAVADASPAATVTDTLFLNGANVSGGIAAGEYTIPPTATPGETLALTSTAANGNLPNASETVSVEIVPQGSVFTFASLYENGEQGMVMDMGDLSTLFQDEGRQNPVTAAGQEIRGFTDASGNGNHGATATGALGWTYQETPNSSGYASQAQLGEQFDVPVGMGAGEEWTFFIAHDGTFETINGDGQFMMGSASNENNAGNATGMVAQDGASLSTFGSETIERIIVDGAVITPASRNELHDQTVGTSQMIFDMTVVSSVWTSTRIGAYPANNNRQPPKGVFVFGMINRRLTPEEETNIATLFAGRTA